MEKELNYKAEIKKKQEEFKIKVGETNLIKDPKGQYRILQESDQLSKAITNLEYNNQKLIKLIISTCLYSSQISLLSSESSLPV